MARRREFMFDYRMPISASAGADYLMDFMA